MKKGYTFRLGDVVRYRLRMLPLYFSGKCIAISAWRECINFKLKPKRGGYKYIRYNTKLQQWTDITTPKFKTIEKRSISRD